MTLDKAPVLRGLKLRMSFASAYKTVGQPLGSSKMLFLKKETLEQMPGVKSVLGFFQDDMLSSLTITYIAPAFDKKEIQDVVVDFSVLLDLRLRHGMSQVIQTLLCSRAPVLTFNINIHAEQTANEIATEFENIDWVFLGTGTTGTIGGISESLRTEFPKIKVVAVEPFGSVTFGEPPRITKYSRDWYERETKTRRLR